jgi:hypothetical protein
MTHQQNTHTLPITDLWLLVDEEQTLRYGMRQSWRWLEADQPQAHALPAPPQPAAHNSTANAKGGRRQVACAA